MALLTTTVVALIAILHIYIMVLEIFLWDSPRGRKAFGTSPEFSAMTKTLGANQGFYNGILAAGLFWGLYLGEAGSSIVIFFLLAIAGAGIFGAVTSSRKILFIQTLPASIALLLMLV
ncbi:MAG: membrane protein [Sulfuricurvum sp. PC08-66]|nr:MAG: membrane protein [Sulfuricurvum sp. PC08-66]